MVLTDKQIWQEILSRSELSEEELTWLEFTTHEFKRSTIFLRKLQELDIPDELILKLRVSAASLDFHLRLTNKWATMADLRAAVGDVRFLWDKWIPRGFITLLAGESKTGKSKIAQWLCRVVTEGLAWPDGTPNPERGNVIYIDAEGSQILAANSASDMGIDLNKVIIPDLGGDMLSQIDLNDDEHKKKFVEMIEDVKPALVIIDSVGGAKSGGENKKEDMQPMMLFLNHLAQEQQFALIAIHHLNKTKREEAEEIALGHVRGSTAIIQFSRSILFLSRKPKGLRFWIGGSNVTNHTEVQPIRAIPIFGERLKEDKVEKYVESYEFELWEDEVKTTKIDECQIWVISQLANVDGNIGQYARELFEMGDETWTTRTIKEAGAILERKGLITRSGGKGSIWKLLQLPMPSSNGHHQEIEEDTNAE